MKCKVVELFGLPGCGKSTLVNAVHDQSTDGFYMYEDYTNYNKSQPEIKKLYRTFIFLIRHASLFGVFNRHNKKYNVKLYLKMIKFLSSLESFLSSVDGLVVLDQGLTQYIGTIVYHSSGSHDKFFIEELVLFFDKLWDHHSVYIKTMKEIASFRAANRGNGYAFDTMDEDNRLKIYEMWEECFDVIYDIEQGKNMDIIEFDNDFDSAKIELKSIITEARSFF